MSELSDLLDSTMMAVRIPADMLVATPLTATEIVLQVREFEMRQQSIADDYQGVNAALMSMLIVRCARDLLRPKGYSQSHWRKIYRQSRLLRPIEIRL